MNGALLPQALLSPCTCAASMLLLFGSLRSLAFFHMASSSLYLTALAPDKVVAANLVEEAAAWPHDLPVTSYA